MRHTDGGQGTARPTGLRRVQCHKGVRRRSKILIGAVLALGIAWVLALLVSHKNARDKVAAYKQELRARGEKLTFAELAPPPSTKTPNGAKALTNLVNYSSGANYPPTMTMIAPGVARIGHTNIGTEFMLNYASNVQRTAELRAILTNAAVLDFNLDYSNVLDLQLSHLSKLKAAEVVVSETAMQSLYRKDYSEAWPDLCAAVDLIRLHDNEPLEISQLVRCALLNVAIGATWEALQENNWTDAQLSELQSKWEATDLLTLLEPSMARERAYGIEALAAMRRSSNMVFGGIMFSGGGTAGNSGSWMDDMRQEIKDLYNRYPRFWKWKSAWSYEEELYYLQIETAAVDASRKITPTGAFVPTFNEFRHQATNIDRMYPDADDHFSQFHLSSSFFNHNFTSLAERETARRLLVTVLALKRYHLQHGAYPANLNELVPNYLKQVPMDFMDGKPLRYRLRPDGDFLLYSVGEDGEDNGGDASPVENGIIKNWLNARDAVWPRAATAAEVAEYESHSASGTNAPGK
jgi:hypothetical protein